MFKLVVKSVSDGEERGQDQAVEAFERSYDKELIRIGRRDSNDLQLRDTRRLISGSHAEIRRRERQWILVDVGSKNGTRLNGAPLTSGKEYPLDPEDEIAIGNFIIEFYPVSPSEARQESAEGKTDATLSLDIAARAEELISGLNRLYWDQSESERSERISLMAGALREAVEGLDPAGAHKMVSLVQARFPEPDYQWQRTLQSSPDDASVVPSEEARISKAAYEGVRNIAGKYFGGEDVLKSRETTERFIGRIDGALALMFDYLSSAVKGRKEFEQEFDVESTRIFSWKPNPIKMAEGEKEIGAYLLDWRKRQGEKAASDLEEVFTDLALHQMGLMAGFKECLRGLLEKLNPNDIEAEALSEPLRWGPLKLPRPAPLVNGAAWRRYRKKHKELLEEEVKTFETILGPHFSKGYLSIQKKKKTH